MLARSRRPVLDEEPNEALETSHLKVVPVELNKNNKDKQINQKIEQVGREWSAEDNEQPTIIAPTLSRTGLEYVSKLASPLTFVVLLGLWQLLSILQVYPAYILPSPAMVAERFVETIQTGALWRHTQITLIEAGLGFGAALLVVGLFAYPIAHSRLVATLLSPLLAATQAVPLVALAPLLVIWFGFGLLPKIVTCALIVFFPLLLNAVAGLRGIEKSLREAAAVFGASRWQTFWLVEFPLALPTFLTGVKIGFTVSITGAVVGEFISSEAGLGYLLNLGRGQFDTPLVFVALLTLTAIATLAYGVVSLLEKLCLKWQ